MGRGLGGLDWGPGTLQASTDTGEKEQGQSASPGVPANESPSPSLLTPRRSGVDVKGSRPLWEEGNLSFVFHLPQISPTGFRNKKKLVSDLEGRKNVPSGERLDRLSLIYVHSANVL